MIYWRLPIQLDVADDVLATLNRSSPLELPSFMPYARAILPHPLLIISASAPDSFRRTVKRNA
jgi:hypothetical protein